MRRAKLRGLARNAAVVLGYVGTSEDVPMLEAALAHDEPLVREHATWALRSVGTRDHSPIAPPSDSRQVGVGVPAEVTTR